VDGCKTLVPGVDANPPLLHIGRWEYFYVVRIAHAGQDIRPRLCV